MKGWCCSTWKEIFLKRRHYRKAKLGYFEKDTTVLPKKCRNGVMNIVHAVLEVSNNCIVTDSLQIAHG